MWIFWILNDSVNLLSSQKLFFQSVPLELDFRFPKLVLFKKVFPLLQIIYRLRLMKSTKTFYSRSLKTDSFSLFFRHSIPLLLWKNFFLLSPGINPVVAPMFIADKIDMLNIIYKITINKCFSTITLIISVHVIHYIVTLYWRQR